MKHAIGGEPGRPELQSSEGAAPERLRQRAQLEAAASLLSPQKSRHYPIQLRHLPGRAPSAARDNACAPQATPEPPARPSTAVPRPEGHSLLHPGPAQPGAPSGHPRYLSLEVPSRHTLARRLLQPPGQLFAVTAAP